MKAVITALKTLPTAAFVIRKTFALYSLPSCANLFKQNQQRRPSPEMQQFNTRFQSLTLQRLPLRSRETLRAWDAADEYLLEHLGEIDISGRVLIFNDNFGALTLNLATCNPVLYSDSWLAHQSAIHNAQRNGIATDSFQCLASTEPLQGAFDHVLIRFPDNLSWLEEQLLRLRPHIHEHTQIIAAGMARYIHTSTLSLLSKILGPTRTSLARKKARLAFVTVDPGLSPATSGFPETLSMPGNLITINHASLFSRKKLDIGTRFFLEHLPDTRHRRNIIDLGCGNGILGLTAASRDPESIVTFVDESYMAVQSARESWHANNLPDDHGRFIVNDCLTGFPANSADLVLCNPPFHQGTTIGDHIARRMFRQAHRILRSGGELRIVGNRHLNYHVRLERLFGNYRLIASNARFVILSSIRTF